jgi:hypothetical protein
MNSAIKHNPVTAFEPISTADMDEHAGQAAAFLKLLANPNRLMILCHLLEGELSVSALNAHLPLSQSTHPLTHRHRAPRSVLGCGPVGCGSMAWRCAIGLHLY